MFGPYQFGAPYFADGPAGTGTPQPPGEGPIIRANADFTGRVMLASALGETVRTSANIRRIVTARSGQP